MATEALLPAPVDPSSTPEKKISLSSFVILLLFIGGCRVTFKQ